MSRLFRNQGGYRGETIDVDAVLHECAAAAEAHGWLRSEIPVEGRPSLPVYVRESREGAPGGGGFRAYVSAGIHGDEPAGVLAVHRLLERHRWPRGLSLVVVPCLNPGGMRLNRRENPDGLDLNRDYRHLRAPEVRAHVRWLQEQLPFGVSFCLHEDWEASGFYLYELNPHGLPSLADAILRRVERVCPLDLSPVIEGRPASGGLIRPAVDPESRPDWPEAFWLMHHARTRLSYTLESPSDYPLARRVEALVEGVTAALESWVGSEQAVAAARSVGGPH